MSEAEAAAFLKGLYGTDSEDFSMDYKPYEYSSTVQTLRFSEAVQLVIKEYQDCLNFCKGFDIENRAKQMVFDILKKHFVVYQRRAKDGV